MACSQSEKDERTRSNWFRFSFLLGEQQDYSTKSIIRWTGPQGPHIWFAACFEHSAKPEKHSAKFLSSMTLSKKSLGKLYIGNSLYSTNKSRRHDVRWRWRSLCQMSCRQRLPPYLLLARLALVGSFGSFFIECIRSHSIKIASLPSAS